jgi:hypothetical protein
MQQLKQTKLILKIEMVRINNQWQVKKTYFVKDNQ